MPHLNRSSTSHVYRLSQHTQLSGQRRDNLFGGGSSTLPGRQSLTPPAGRKTEVINRFSTIRPNERANTFNRLTDASDFADSEFIGYSNRESTLPQKIFNNADKTRDKSATRVVFEDIQEIEGKQNSFFSRETYKPLLSRKSKSPVANHDSFRRTLYSPSPSFKETGQTETAASVRSKLGFGKSQAQKQTSTKKEPQMDTKVRDMRILNLSLQSKLQRLREEKVLMVKLNKALISKLSALSQGVHK